MKTRPAAPCASCRREQALNALTPALGLLAFVTDYAGLKIDSLWLLVVILLALMGSAG